MWTIPGRISSRAPPHHHLTYGRGCIIEWCAEFFWSNDRDAYTVLDIGCGYGQDLQNIRDAAPQPVPLYGIEIHVPAIHACEGSNITVFPVDIEREQFPVQDHFFDIILLNQVLEHTKEIFFIFSGISRVLKPGGILIVGVPNLTPFHNRLLFLFGRQPTSIETLGPHVRGFTIPALKKFIEEGGYFRALEVRGANFYPFPPVISGVLCRIFRGGTAIIFSGRENGEGGAIHRGAGDRVLSDGLFFWGPGDKILKECK